MSLENHPAGGGALPTGAALRLLLRLSRAPLRQRSRNSNENGNKHA